MPDKTLSFLKIWLFSISIHIDAGSPLFYIWSVVLLNEPPQLVGPGFVVTAYIYNQYFNINRGLKSTKIDLPAMPTRDTLSFLRKI
jgi:hypothetical protein